MMTIVQNKRIRLPKLLLLFHIVTTIFSNSLTECRALKSRSSLKSGGLPFRLDWKNEKKPDFCQGILRNPKPFTRECKRNSKNMTCVDHHPHEFVMFSQFQQDYYVYSEHFKHKKDAGVYVDIAANDPIGISNTYFLDRCLGWYGLCVEANHQYFESLYRERSCEIVPTCVGSIDGMRVNFGLDGGAGGILDDTYKSMKKLKNTNKTITTKSMKCTTMEKVLKRTGIKEVDYLSLDVEGHEMEVLKGFGLDDVIIKVMTIEVTGSDLPKLEDFLKEKGYKRHFAEHKAFNKRSRLLQEDAVFLHESVTFGSP